jgi:CxxC motif-containing protein (DUF1111 family)
MHPEIIVSASAHSASEEVASAFVSKAAYDALAERLAAAEKRALKAEKNLKGMRTMLELSIELCHTPEHSQDEEWHEKLNAIQDALEAWDLIHKVGQNERDEH